MHGTAFCSGEAFSKTYGKEGMVVLDVGGQDVNGSLRSFFESRGMKYICMDMVAHPSVDIVVPPGERFPFEDGTIDLVVSTSCFEHDPCFWMTFREMTRVVKVGGYIYVNAPTRGDYHGYPGDNWRFFPDAGQALAVWSGRKFGDEGVFPAKVVETFNILGDGWNDFVCVWERSQSEPETNIVVSPAVRQTVGVLEREINRKYATRKSIP